MLNSGSVDFSGEKAKEDYIYKTLDQFANGEDKSQSEVSRLAHAYGITYGLSFEDLRDSAIKTGDMDLAAIAVMKENNFTEALKKLPNCLELSDCDISVKDAVSTYTRLLQSRDKLVIFLRYIVEDRFGNSDNRPISIPKEVLYNILLRKDMEPTTDETTLTRRERGFITALVSIVDADEGDKIGDVLDSEEVASLITMVNPMNIDEAISRINGTLIRSGNGYILFDKRTLQVLLNLIDRKKVSKAFNTILFKEISKKGVKEKDTGYEVAFNH